ncbi:MAG: helix-turn-helix domain-containing protein [Candidatus Bathyarchaeota archaeon]|nr:helix-turn-helix domain-containing protein [Candidatus Bathyarchaeota archaeon]
MIEALLNIRIPELWITSISEKYDVKISCQVGGQSSKGGWGLATIEGDDGILDDVIEEVRQHPSVGDVKVKARNKGITSFLVDVVKCKACDVLSKSKAFMIYPVDIHKGRMKWLLITDNNRTMGKICEGLEEYKCDVKIERVIALIGKGILTERQEEIAREAFSSGYFDYPKRINSLKLAKKLGISISTLSEVLRAAQRRIFAEYLRT